MVDPMEMMREAEQPTSFLGRIGSFLWTGVKWLTGIAAIVFTAGAALHYFPAAKKWLNDVSGENKLGDKGDELFNDTVEGAKTLPRKLNDMMPWGNGGSKHASPSSVSKVIDINGNPALIPTGDFEPKLAIENLKTLYKDKAALNAANVTSEQRKKGLEEFNDKINQLSAFAGKVDGWNLSAEAFNKKYPQTPYKPLALSMNIPNLPANLENFGRSIDGSSWDKKTNFEKIDFVREALDKRTKTEPNFDKLALGGSWLTNTLEGTNRLTDLLKVRDVTDASGEEIRKRRIKEYFTEGNMQEVAQLAQNAKKQFEDKIKDTKTTDENYGNYKRAIESFGEISDYGLMMQMKKESEKSHEAAIAGIVETYQTAGSQLKSYAQKLQLKNSDKGVTSANTSSKPQPSYEGLLNGKAFDKFPGGEADKVIANNAPQKPKLLGTDQPTIG